MSMAANPQTVETPTRLPKPGDVDWFLTAADRARAAKATRQSCEAPTMWGQPDPRVLTVVVLVRRSA